MVPGRLIRRARICAGSRIEMPGPGRSYSKARSIGLLEMTRLYSAAPLEPTNADHAFPLVSLRYPELSLPDWRTVVRHLSRAPRDRGGLMMVRNARGCVLAVFAYRTGEPLVG